MYFEDFIIFRKIGFQSLFKIFSGVFQIRREAEAKARMQRVEAVVHGWFHWIHKESGVGDVGERGSGTGGHLGAIGAAVRHEKLDVLDPVEVELSHSVGGDGEHPAGGGDAEFGELIVLILGGKRVHEAHGILGAGEADAAFLNPVGDFKQGDGEVPLHVGTIGLGDPLARHVLGELHILKAIGRLSARGDTRAEEGQPGIGDLARHVRGGLSR